MKTVQTSTNQYLLLNFSRKAIKKLFLMVVSSLFLFTISCSKNQSSETEIESKKTAIRSTIACDLGNVNCTDFYRTGQYVINGCTINVTYTFRKCGTSFEIRDFDYTFNNSAACDAIQQQWSILYNTSSLAANNAMNAFYKQLSILVENYEIGLLNPIAFACPSSNYQLTWVETHCHVLCAQKGDGEGLWKLTQVICGDACCIRLTKFCILPDGTINRKEVGVTQINSFDCEPVPVGCTYGNYDPASCQKACARL